MISSAKHKHVLPVVCAARNNFVCGYRTSSPIHDVLPPSGSVRFIAGKFVDFPVPQLGYIHVQALSDKASLPCLMSISDPRRPSSLYFRSMYHVLVILTLPSRLTFVTQLLLQEHGCRMFSEISLNVQGRIIVIYLIFLS